ncbi:hypothetical protein MSG28_015984 [Choristoneura fumiferana]|uniref:Uncharacterized protein n=1 Tax=Choristoneura fumiferana TaxID=7141 RepID=A0ACC0K4T3_CHOFU|nr:hypothetical protein MSG28_015984 [Choristoneura fumiferana]
MAALKSLLVLVLLAVVLPPLWPFGWGRAIRFAAAIDPEKDECCRAHGHSGWSSCAYGQMHCY